MEIQGDIKIIKRRSHFLWEILIAYEKQKDETTRDFIWKPRISYEYVTGGNLNIMKNINQLPQIFR